MTTGRFRIINSELSGREFVLPDHPATVGRGSGNDIVIPDQSVSRQHVRVEVKDGRCVLTDLGSHNGILFGGKTLREVVVASGERFELGDVAIEFNVEAGDETAVVQPPAAGPEQYAVAKPGAMPAERPVYVDDLFGPGVVPAAAGPGEAEKAAVTGARGAIKYMLIIAAIVGVGAIAWQLAGGRTAEENVKPVIVKAGETKVIDLGLRTRQADGRLMTYVDETEKYSRADYVNPDGEGIALLRLDDTGYMAVIEGISFGETDVRLVGRGGRRATVRILVRGALPRPPGEDRLEPEARIAQGKLLVNSGRAAQAAGRVHQAMKRFREAIVVLEPLKAIHTPEATALSRDADRLYRQAKDELDKRFQKTKAQVVLRLQDGDESGALKAVEELQNLVPDETDELNQKLRIIRDRIFERIRRKYR